jgi:hypothetical protein
MRRRNRRKLTAPEKRALTSAGLFVTRYGPDCQRATVEQLTAKVSDTSRPTHLKNPTPLGEQEESTA